MNQPNTPDKIHQADRLRGDAASPDSAPTDSEKMCQDAHRHRADDDTIGDLWMRMIESYGHRWSSQYGEIPPPGQHNPAMETWARGLTGISPRHIRLGLTKAVQNGDPWPPSLPAFRSLCVPRLADFGLPAPAIAWGQARAAMAGPNRRHRWPHPALRLAARHARKGHNREARFLAAYRHLCQRVFNGEALSDPLPPCLLSTPEPPASPDEARRHLKALKAIVNPVTASPLSPNGGPTKVAT